MARRPAPAAVVTAGSRPRRWLPFVALTALVVGRGHGVVRGARPAPRRRRPGARRQPPARRDRRPTPSPPPGTAPAAPPRPTTASPSSRVVLANDADRGAAAEVTVYDEEGDEAVAGGRGARPTAGPGSRRADVLEGQWVGAARRGARRPGGGRPRGHRPARVRRRARAPPRPATAGTCRRAPRVRGAEEYLSLFNPFPDSASVSISFATDTGRRTPRALRALSIPGRSVRVVKVSDDITNRSAIAATVIARSGRVVVDRVQTYDGAGDPLAGADGSITEPAPPEGLISTPGIAGARPPLGVRRRPGVARGPHPDRRLQPHRRHRPRSTWRSTTRTPSCSPRLEPVELDHPAARAGHRRPRRRAPAWRPTPTSGSTCAPSTAVPVVAERLSYFALRVPHRRHRHAGQPVRRHRVDGHPGRGHRASGPPRPGGEPRAPPTPRSPSSCSPTATAASSASASVTVPGQRPHLAGARRRRVGRHRDRAQHRAGGGGLVAGHLGRRGHLGAAGVPVPRVRGGPAPRQLARLVP